MTGNLNGHMPRRFLFSTSPFSGLDYAVQLIEDVAASCRSVAPVAIAELSAAC